jgi:fructose-1-phosphate kinase PfkB-like protein
VEGELELEHPTAGAVARAIAMATPFKNVQGTWGAGESFIAGFSFSRDRAGTGTGVIEDG